MTRPHERPRPARTLLRSPAPRGFRGVQALRLIAAVLVVVTHATYYTSERLVPSMSVWLQGGVGVSLFFAVSGFVMYLTSRGLGGRDWIGFGLRRVYRVAPLYWIVTTVKVATLVAVPVAVLHATLKWDVLVLSYAFLPSRNPDGDVQPFFAVGWTLMFEMAFYAIVCIAIAARLDVVRVGGVVLGSLAALNLLRGPGWPAWAFYFDPVVLMFLAGLVIARWTDDRRNGRALASLTGIVALWVVVSVFRHDGSSPEAISPVAQIAMIAVLALAVVFEPWLARVLPKWVIWLGDASYSLYLTHPIVAPMVPAVMAFLGLFGARFGTASVVLSILVSVAASAIVHSLVERPIHRLLVRTLPKRSPGSGGAIAARRRHRGHRPRPT